MRAQQSTFYDIFYDDFYDMIVSVAFTLFYSVFQQKEVCCVSQLSSQSPVRGAPLLKAADSVTVVFQYE